MSCDAWHEQLIAFLDGELDESGRSALDEHLAACPSCREDLAELEATSGVLRSWEPAEPPAGLVFDRRPVRRAGAFGWLVEGWAGSRLRAGLVPATLGAALAAAVTWVLLVQRPPDPAVATLEARVAALEAGLAEGGARRAGGGTGLAGSETVLAGGEAGPAGAEAGLAGGEGKAAPGSTQLAQNAGEEAGPDPGAAPEARSPAVADLGPETRAWLLQAVERLVRDSESRQEAKLLLTADQLARSLALQRREDLEVVDRRLRDVRAETFEALVSTHERLDQITRPVGSEGGQRLEPR